MGLYSLIFAFDLKVNGINPPDQKYTIPISISVTLPSNRQLAFTDMIVDVIVTYYGTLVAGRNASLFAAATLQTPIAFENVSNVMVGFDFSYGYPLTYYENHTAISTWVYLTRSGSSDSMSGYNTTVFWPTSGYSPPYVKVIFNNGLPFYQSFPEYAIFIQPMSELQTERANRVNVGLTISLVGFSLVEGTSRVYDNWKDKDESRTKEKTENTDDCKCCSSKYSDEYQ